MHECCKFSRSPEISDDLWNISVDLLKFREIWQHRFTAQLQSGYDNVVENRNVMEEKQINDSISMHNIST